jgi:hypothetical protein
MARIPVHFIELSWRGLRLFLLNRDRFLNSVVGTGSNIADLIPTFPSRCHILLSEDEVNLKRLMLSNYWDELRPILSERLTQP